MKLFKREEPFNEVKERQPFTVVKNELDNTAEVNLYGEVVNNRPKDFWTDEVDDSMYIVLREFLDELNGLANFDKVTFRINSVGGDADAGKAIYNRIREMDAETTTIVDGLAASAASIIFMAGDNRQVNVGSQIMVHGASTLLIGYYNAADVKGALDMLKGYDNSLAEIYADRTGSTKEAMARMIQNTTWLSASDAVEKGFADEIVNSAEPVAAKVSGAEDLIIVNGNPLRLPPDMMPALRYRQTVPIDKVFRGKGSLNIDTNNIQRKETKIMNIEELKAQYPDLVDAIAKEASEAARAESEKVVADAIQAERDRIKGIEEIQNRISDKALVQKAKFDTAMDAKELAFEAMKAEADINAKALDALDTDAKDSGVNDVTPDPVQGSEDETRKQDVADGAALIAAAFNR